MDEIVQEGRTREEALQASLQKLGVEEKDVEVETLESPREGLFGLFGSRPVKLRVKIKAGAGAASDVPEGNTVRYAQTPQAAFLKGDENPEDLVRNFIEKIFQHLEVKCDIDVHEGENSIYVDITGEDAGVVIGKFGQTLDAVQFITNVVISKRYCNKKKIIIDVGDYRERRESSIQKLARSVARKVMKTRKEEALAPMPPQDRRIVHLALASFEHIATTSEGAGQNRKVIISYKE
jgi:spoIIIJ-associated protein